MREYSDLLVCEFSGEWRATLFMHVSPNSIVRRDQYSAPLFVEMVEPGISTNSRIYTYTKLDSWKGERTPSNRIIYPDTLTCEMWFPSEDWEAVTQVAFEAAREELRRLL